MSDVGQAVVYGLAAIVVIACIGAYTYHVWSDCLEENSVLTCMRMLGK